VWVYVTQRGQIYFPTPGVRGAWRAGAVGRVRRRADQGVGVERAGSRALLYFGGNAEDVAGNIDLFAAAFPDRSLYLVNYRGYGGVPGGRPRRASSRMRWQWSTTHTRDTQTLPSWGAASAAGSQCNLLPSGRLRGWCW